MTSFNFQTILNKELISGDDDFIGNEHLIPCPDKVIKITTCNKLKNFLHILEDNSIVIEITEINFKEAKKNSNNVSSFVKLNDNTLVNAHTYEKLTIDVDNSKATLSCDFVTINEEEIVKHSNYLQKSIDEGNDILGQRINKLNNEKQKIKKELANIQTFINNKCIINAKEKHYNINNKEFQIDNEKFETNDKYKQTIIDHPCSITFAYSIIFKDRSAYENAIIYIKDCDFDVIKIKDDILNKIFTGQYKDEYLMKNLDIILICNKYLICLMINKMRDYIKYIDSCIDKLQYNPYALNEGIAYNDVVPDFMELTDEKQLNKYGKKYEIRIKNSYIEGFVRKGEEYYHIGGFIFYEHEGKWNIMCYENEKKTNFDKIKDLQEYKSYIKTLEKNAKKAMKGYNESKKIKGKPRTLQYCESIAHIAVESKIINSNL